MKLETAWRDRVTVLAACCLLTLFQPGFVDSVRAAERGSECEPPLAIGSNEDFSGLTVYMRGSLYLDWGVWDNNFSDQTAGTYIARIPLSAGTFEWKIADQEWQLDYCTKTTLEVNTLTNASVFFGCFPPNNGVIEVPSNGCYEFEMTTDGNIPPDSVDIIFRPFELPEIVLESGFEDDEM